MSFVANVYRRPGIFTCRDMLQPVRALRASVPSVPSILPVWRGLQELLNGEEEYDRIESNTHRIHGAAIYGNIYHQYTSIYMIV